VQSVNSFVSPCLTGRIAYPCFAPYSTAKFALDGFFSALRQELATDDIDVSVTMCYIGLTGLCYSLQYK